jgi:hypothetical protein
VYESFMKEIRIVPSLGFCRHGGRRDDEHGAEMLAQRPDLVDSLITHRFPLDDAPDEAFPVAADKSTGRTASGAQAMSARALHSLCVGSGLAGSTSATDTKAYRSDVESMRNSILLTSVSTSVQTFRSK